MTRQVRLVLAMLVAGPTFGCSGSGPAGPSVVAPPRADGVGIVHGMPRRSMGGSIFAPACSAFTTTVTAEPLTVDFSVCAGSPSTSLFVGNNGPSVISMRAGTTVTTADTAVPAGSGALASGVVVSLVTAGGSATVTLTPVE